MQLCFPECKESRTSTRLRLGPGTRWFVVWWSERARVAAVFREAGLDMREALCSHSTLHGWPAKLKAVRVMGWGIRSGGLKARTPLRLRMHTYLCTDMPYRHFLSY